MSTGAMIDARDAISRIQAMRDTAASELPPVYDDRDTDAVARETSIRTYDAVLDVLQSMAHGVTPAQGAEEKSGCEAADHGEQTCRFPNCGCDEDPERIAHVAKYAAQRERGEA